MERTEFEALRDFAGKTIRGEVRLSVTSKTRPVYAADDVRIEGTSADLLLNANYTPEIGRLVINVHARGQGPICRLCVNGSSHGSAGRTHKHAVKTGRCVSKNLPDATMRSDLVGKTVEQVWQQFCREANITHVGAFVCDDYNVTLETL